MLRLNRFRAATAFVVLCAVSLSGCNSSEERAQSHYERGVELAAKGEPVKAALEFRNALKLKSGFVDALYALGEVEERQGKFQSAAKRYATVAERAPDNVEARIRLANILLASGQATDALKFADEAVALAGEEPRVLVTKAAIKLKLGNRDEAIELANKALELDPEFVDALMVLAADRLRSGDATEALAYLDKAPQSSERNIALQILRLTALEVVGDQPGVEDLFGKLIDLFPDSPVFRQGLVRWYLDKGRKQDAEDTLRKFASDNPNSEVAQYGLINFLNSEKGADAAIEQLESLVANPEIEDKMRFQMRMALAQLKFSSGDAAGAAELMTTIVADAKGDQRNQARIAFARIAASQENYDEALKLVDAVLEEDAKNPDALGVRAQIRLAKGHFDQATDDLLVAVNEAPQNARLRTILGDAYEKAGKVTLAEDEYAKALALNDDPADAGLRMARFLLRYGRTTRARQVLEDVATRVPGDRRVLAMLGDVRLATQDWVGAEEIAKKLRALDDASNAAIADKIAAAALSGMQRYSDSVNLLKASLTPGETSFNADLVRAYVQAGQVAEAENYLKDLLESEPGNIQALVLLGSIYASTQRLDEAEDVFKKAAADKEDSEIGSTALAQFYASAGRMKDAEAAARAGIESAPDSTALRLLLSAIMQRTGQFDEAIAIYEEMFKKDPESTAVANDLASLLSERRGDPQSLDRAYEIAQRFRNSEIPQYLDTLGWIHFLRGEYASALPLVKSAADRLPKVGLVHYHLGMVQKALGQNDVSMASLEKAVSLPASMTASDLDKAKSAIDDLKEAAASEVSN